MIRLEETRFLRLGDVARYLGESESTVLERVERGELEPVREPGRRMVKYRTREVLALADRIDQAAGERPAARRLEARDAELLDQVERELGRLRVVR